MVVLGWALALSSSVLVLAQRVCQVCWGTEETSVILVISDPLGGQEAEGNRSPCVHEGSVSVSCIWDVEEPEVCGRMKLGDSQPPPQLPQ